VASGSQVEIAVEGEVERITFENRETNFRVVKVAVEGRHDSLTMVGVFPHVAVGARVRARGMVEIDRQHGEQLRVSSVTELRPTTLSGIEKYLGSGLVKGIGGRTAQRIVEHFGLDTLKVLDEEPHRLSEIQGLGRARIKSLCAAWKEQRAIRDVMVFLQAHGASPQLATRIFKRYGPKAVSIVSADPYRLAMDVWGIGFRTADRIASSMGIESDSQVRMQAALLQALGDATDAGGHCYVIAEDLIASAAELLAPGAKGAPSAKEQPSEPRADTPERLDQALAALVRGGHVVAEQAGGLTPARADALSGAAIYNPRMRATETRLAKRFAELACAKAADLPGGAEAIAEFEKSSGTVLADEQRLAVDKAARCPLLIITGGPGVGKTTIVKAILSVFDRAKIATRLAAPTGRAAKRMSEATGREAATLHRLLEFEPKTGSFKRDASRPVEAGAIVVDESSMLDVQLADALAQAVGDGTRLVLVGDVDQLPSVGPGSVLRDTIDSAVVPCVRLRKIFRQVERSLIVQNAHKINAGESLILPEKGDISADFFFIEKHDPDAARKVILELVTRRIPARFGFDPVRDVQVLTPMNRGPAGTLILNEELQAALNGEGRGITRGRTTFRVGDKVMQLRNNYDKNVYNGDVGVVSSVDEVDESLVVRFDDGPSAAGGLRDVTYDLGALDELTLAYATTIHKSQGSEYPAVIITLLTSHFVMLNKNLIYTGVTRGKRLVVLVADARALSLALTPRTDRNWLERKTKLSARLRVPLSI